VSARNLNALYIVARPSGKVVWRYYEGLDWQHEARMVPAGFPGAGNILLFNNGYHTVERQSTLVELNPLERAVVWSYRSPGFFSATEGVQQALSNGNLLVTSSHGGRVFEITRKGRIVWQWVPPYPPVRVSRYPYDFCPQLEALAPPPERAIDRRDPERFVDSDQYSFALHDVRHVSTGESSVVLLRRSSQCRELRLPDEAEMTIGYGIDRRERCEEALSRKVRFGVSIRPSHAEEAEELLERTVRFRGAGRTLLAAPRVLLPGAVRPSRGDLPHAGQRLGGAAPSLLRLGATGNPPWSSLRGEAFRGRQARRGPGVRTAAARGPGLRPLTGAAGCALWQDAAEWPPTRGAD